MDGILWASGKALKLEAQFVALATLVLQGDGRATLFQALKDMEKQKSRNLTQITTGMVVAIDISKTK
jgi:hypothetical protein